MTRMSWTPSALQELETFGVIATGGMATIEYARQVTPAGSLELVVKRPHARFANDPGFAAMFMDEARLSIRIRHANVVRTLGVVEEPTLALLLEYVPGESLRSLFKLSQAAAEPIPTPIAAALVAGALHGLHAAHQTCGEDGQLLHIVHRDVTPENILVGVDGVARVFDFGIAKALGKLRHTPSGELRGKLAYLAPEQVCGRAASLQTDVYAAAVVLWEALAGRSLFGRPLEAATIDSVMREAVPSLCQLRSDVPGALDRIVQSALSREPSARFESAHAMARALEREVGVASQSEVMDWLEHVAGARLRKRSSLLESMRIGTGERATETAISVARSGSRTRSSQPPELQPTAANLRTIDIDVDRDLMTQTAPLELRSSPGDRTPITTRPLPVSLEPAPRKPRARWLLTATVACVAAIAPLALAGRLAPPTAAEPDAAAPPAPRTAPQQPEAGMPSNPASDESPASPSRVTPAARPSVPRQPARRSGRQRAPLRVASPASFELPDFGPRTTLKLPAARVVPPSEASLLSMNFGRR